MKPIELDCPECSESLALDAGFAGGVCRCSNCGTLMTVPANPASGKAEQLMRPDEPGQPAVRRAKPGKAKAPAAPAPGTYVTRSGKEVRISEKTKIPTAPKRIKAAKYGTIAIFVAVMVVLLGGAGYIGYMLVNRTISGPVDTTPIERFAYDAYAAPSALPGSNVLGIPVTLQTAVIVDVSEGADAWRQPMEAALVAGLMQPNERRELMLLYVNGDGVEAWRSGPRALSETDPAELQDFMKGIKSGGAAPLAEALQRVVDKGVDHAIIITGRPLSREDTAAMLKIAQAAPSLRVEVAMADDADSVGLDDLVVATQPEDAGDSERPIYHNVYTRISLDRLEDWAAAATP